MSRNFVIVDAPDCSDGDPTHRPAQGSGHRLVNPSNTYLEKLGTAWMNHQGKAQPGVRYLLSKLPSGYEVYEKTRTNGGQTDRWLFGNPGHKYFDSPNRFLPHFLHFLKNEGSNFGCPCTVCIGTAGRGPSMGAAAGKQLTATVPKPRGRPPATGKAILSKPMQTGPTDEEGNPDVYRILIDRLKKAGSLDVPITEPMSMDWRTESEPSGKQLEDIADQPGWVPRVGEIVLFVRKLEPDETIAYYHQTDSYRVFGSSEQKTYRPTWEAGVITQPSMEKLGIDDLTTETRHDYQVNYSGFRVEPLPDSNSKDKTLSLQHKYIPLSHIRPFIFWRQFLRNIDEKRWHPTILNAVKVISSLSLRNRYHFSGSWPTATISCKGIYIGSELLIPGDMVRITPKSDHDDVTDILRITSIKVRMHRLDQASDNDNDDRHPYNLSVHVAGKAYTTDASKAHDESEAVDLAEYKLEEFAGYSSQWYLRHAPNKKLEVPFFRIMGRCYEDEPMATWLSEQSATHLGEGLSGLLEARAYSEKHDKRILEGKSWFWGEDRAESLGLETLNGQEVSRFDESRDPKRWRKEIRVLEGVADEKERQALKDQSMSHRPLRGYEAGNSMVGAAMQIESSEAPSVADEEEGRSGRSSRKRSRSIAESGNGRLASGRYDGKGDDEEEEDEQAAVNDFIDELAEGIALPMDDEMMDRDDDSEPG